MLERLYKERKKLEEQIQNLQRGSIAWIAVYGKICNVQGRIDQMTVYGG